MKDKLINYCDVVRGVSYSPYDLRDSYNDKTYYLLRSNNIKDGVLNFKDVQIVNQDCVSPNQKLLADDIAVCMSNGSKRLVGKSAQFKGDSNNFCVGAFCAGFRPNTNSVPSFIYQLFQGNQYQKYIDITLAGSAINNLKGSDVLNFEFRFPPLPQQKKISKILSTCDEVIEQTEEAIAKYQAIKQGMMHDLFTRGIDLKTGKLRPKYEDAKDLYKKSELGMIPKDWEVETVEDLTKKGILDDLQDGNHGEIHPKSSDFVEVGIPFIMASDITKGFIDLSKCARITEKQYKSLRIGFSKAGDILLSHKASIGFVAKVPNELNEIMLTPQVTYYRVLNQNVILPNYLMYYLSCQLFQTPLHNLAKQSTRDYIGITMQKKLHISYPINIKEQFLLENSLIAIDDKINSEKSSLDKNKQIKSGLMQDLLTGKVEVKVEATT